jgi:predicted DNA-binding transcriptional regulator AlpA
MTSETDQVVVSPILPGWLTIAEIAQLAGVGLTTIRGYHATGSAQMPKPTSRAGNSPLWSLDSIIEWLRTRPLSKTSLEVKPDGSIIVTKASDYRERKAAGTLVPPKEKKQAVVPEVAPEKAPESPVAVAQQPAARKPAKKPATRQAQIAQPEPQSVEAPAVSKETPAANPAAVLFMMAEPAPKKKSSKK